MDKDRLNRIVAISICAFMFLLYLQNVWYPFTRPELYKQSSNPVDGGSASSVSSSPQPPVISNESISPTSIVPQVDVVSFPTDDELSEKGILRIETALIKSDLALMGGRFKEFFLKDYTETVHPDSANLSMIDHVSGASLPLGVYQGAVSDAKVLYKLVSAPDRGNDGVYRILDKPQTFVMEGALSNGGVIKKLITIDPNSYLIGLKIEVTNKGLERFPVEVEWTKRMTDKSPSLLDPYAAGAFVWYDGEKVTREAFQKFEKDAKKSEEIEKQARTYTGKYELPFSGMRWVSLGDVYFVSALVLDQRTAEGKIQKANGRVMKTPELYRARLQVEANGGEFKLYIGPKKLDTISSVGYDLYKTIDIGYTGFISVPMMHLLSFLNLVLRNYGLAIIAFALLAKLVMIPLTLTTFKQAKAMQAVAPEVKRLREQVKDPQQQRIQMMELYKKRGVNPMGGCLPMLIQLPIFIGLYAALQLSFDLRHAPFGLWIQDLSAKEALMIGGVGVPVMVIIFIITTVLQMWLTPMGEDPEQQTQKKIMIFLMPVMFGFMFMNLPAGLTLYFLTNNLIAIAQQKAFNHGNVKSVVLWTLIVGTLVIGLGYIVTKL